MILLSQIVSFLSILITMTFMISLIVGVMLIVTSETIKFLKSAYEYIKLKFFKKDRH